MSKRGRRAQKASRGELELVAELPDGYQMDELEEIVATVPRPCSDCANGDVLVNPHGDGTVDVFARHEPSCPRRPR